MRGVEQFRVVPVLLVLLICLHVGVSALPQTATSSGNSSEGEIFEELAVTGKNNSTGDIATKAFEFYSKVTSFLYSCLWIQMKDLMAKGEVFGPESRIRRGTVLSGLWQRAFPTHEQRENANFKEELEKINNRMAGDIKTVQETGELSNSLKHLIPKDLHDRFRDAVHWHENYQGGQEALGKQLFAKQFADYLSGLVTARSNFLSEYRKESTDPLAKSRRILKLLSGAPEEGFLQVMQDHDPGYVDAYTWFFNNKKEELEKEFEKSLMRPSQQDGSGQGVVYQDLSVELRQVILDYFNTGRDKLAAMEQEIRPAAKQALSDVTNEALKTFEEEGKAEPDLNDGGPQLDEEGVRLDGNGSGDIGGNDDRIPGSEGDIDGNRSSSAESDTSSSHEYLPGPEHGFPK
eukprot:Nk52_evm8s289 gene=Nk52_evmTU8s289